MVAVLTIVVGVELLVEVEEVEVEVVEEEDG